MKILTEEREVKKEFEQCSILADGRIYAKRLKCLHSCFEFVAGKEYDFWLTKTINEEYNATAISVIRMNDAVPVIYEVSPCFFENIEAAPDVLQFTDAENHSHVRTYAKHGKEIEFKKIEYLKHEFEWIITRCLCLKSQGKGINITFTNGIVFLNGDNFHGDEARLFSMACLEELGWMMPSFITGRKASSFYSEIANPWKYLLSGFDNIEAENFWTSEDENYRASVKKCLMKN